MQTFAEHRRSSLQIVCPWSGLIFVGVSSFSGLLSSDHVGPQDTSACALKRSAFRLDSRGYEKNKSEILAMVNHTSSASYDTQYPDSECTHSRVLIHATPCFFATDPSMSSSLKGTIVHRQRTPTFSVIIRALGFNEKFAQFLQVINITQPIETKARRVRVVSMVGRSCEQRETVSSAKMTLRTRKIALHISPE